MTRNGADDAVHPVRRGVDVPLVVHRLDGPVDPGRRVIVDERVEQAALIVEAAAAPRDEDAEVPTPPPWTLRCIPNASPMDKHLVRLLGYRVREAPGSLTTAGSRTVNVLPSP